jgi:hypothetical protein
VADAGSCSQVTTAMCNQAGTSQASFISACQLYIVTGQALGLSACH